MNSCTGTSVQGFEQCELDKTMAEIQNVHARCQQREGNDPLWSSISGRVISSWDPNV